MNSSIPSLIRVEINGVEHELTPTMGDLVRYERKWGTFGAETMTPEQLMYLTWLMAVRTKAIDGDFEAFLDAVGPLEPVVPPKSVAEAAVAKVVAATGADWRGLEAMPLSMFESVAEALTGKAT